SGELNQLNGRGRHLFAELAPQFEASDPADWRWHTRTEGDTCYDYAVMEPPVVNPGSGARLFVLQRAQVRSSFDASKTDEYSLIVADADSRVDIRDVDGLADLFEGLARRERVLRRFETALLTERMRPHRSWVDATREGRFEEHQFTIDTD